MSFNWMQWLAANQQKKHQTLHREWLGGIGTDWPVFQSKSVNEGSMDFKKGNSTLNELVQPQENKIKLMMIV